jgi:hypothetical protein
MNDNSNCEGGSGTAGFPEKQPNRPVPVGANPRERGQILAIGALMMMAMLGVTAMVVDVGRVFISYHELQASTDAAALAGGEALGAPSSTTTTTDSAVTLYSSTNSDKNAYSNLTGVTTTTTLECLTTLTTDGIPCYGAGAYNAVQVQQTVNMPTTFAAIFGTPTVALTATSTAAMAGAATTPYNVAIIVDTTASMSSSDSNCGSGQTRLSCALGGVQTLLGELLPCASEAATCTVNASGVADNPVDQVALFTFPSPTTTTAPNDYTCPTSNPAIEPYTFPTATLNKTTGLQNMPYSITTGSGRNAVTTTYTMTYQVTYGTGSNGYLSDYRASDTASTINTTSQIATAAGANTTRNCGGMKNPGGQSTYYAAAIYAAANSLLSQQALNPTTANALILVSDGDAEAGQANMANVTGSSTTLATSGGTYPSWKNECHQAITAAQAAAAAGIRVYAVAYGAESSGCSTDSPAITPCTTMGDIASSPAYFYSDYNQSGNGIDTSCTGTGGAGNSLTSIKQIFTSIFTSFTVARLIPNSTT